MAGTRTAPLWTAAANQRLVGLLLIDASGDLWAESFYVPVATTAAALEAWAAAYAAASQASLYGLQDMAIRIGDADPDNATTDQRNSVKDGINLLFKNVTLIKSITPRVVAPVTTDLQGNQDIPLLIGTPLEDVITSILAIQTGYSMQSAQYTERRERKNNARIKA